MPAIALPQFNPAEALNNPLIEITQSSISTFNECQFKYVFAYLMRMRTRTTAPALLIGTAVHLALEYILSPQVAKLPPQHIARNVDKILNDYFDDYLEKSDVSIAQSPDLIERCRLQATAVVEAWQIVHADWREEFSVIHTEFTVRSTASNVGADRLTRMAGKIDGLVLSKQDGLMYILEHKTRGSLHDFTFASGLDLDQQCLFYAVLAQIWLSRQPTLLSELGKKPKSGKGHSLLLPSGFFYDAMVKPQHKTGETYNEKLNYMVQKMIEEPTKYFYMGAIELDTKIVDWARGHFINTINAMDRLGHPLQAIPNLKACGNYGGCPYQPLCKAGADANDPAGVTRLAEFAMYRIGQPHEELNVDRETE
jgi:hypothetical protein